jgi:hypothetical protein
MDVMQAFLFAYRKSRGPATGQQDFSHKAHMKLEPLDIESPRRQIPSGFFLEAAIT